MFRNLFVLFSLCIFLQGFSAQAQEAAEDGKSHALLAGLGIGVETGILGVQYRYLATPNWFLQGSAVVDLLGTGWGVGAGYQTDASESTCLFFVDCIKRYRFSLSHLQYGGTTTDLSTSGETECEDGFCVSAGGADGASYKASSSQALSATVGWQDQFGSSFFYELQLGYWMMTKKPDFTYQSGPQRSTDLGNLEILTDSHLAFGITLGFYL